MVRLRKGKVAEELLKDFSSALISRPQKGPAERGHVKKRQKSSKSAKNIVDSFRHISRRAKNVKNRQKVSKIFSTLFDKFRTAPVFRPVLEASDLNQTQGKATRPSNHPPKQQRKSHKQFAQIFFCMFSAHFQRKREDRQT